MNGITFLICTYNGALRIPETLRHLAAQTVPTGRPWEVIVVSNASTDDTLNIAARLWNDTGVPTLLRVYDEPQPGKENALVRGFKEAKYEYISIVDDDNWLFPDYLTRACAVMDAHPEIGILGACAEGAFEIQPPEWFAQHQAVYAIGPQAENAGPLLAPQAYVYGAGSVVRNSAWQRLCSKGFKFTTSAKRGAVISGGEDLEMGYAMRLAGYTIWYDPSLRLHHFMVKERLTWQYLSRIGKGTSTDMTSIVYFFLLREPLLTEPIFKRRYYRWVVWKAWQLLRYPGRLITYWLHHQDGTRPETFNTMRQLIGLRDAITGYGEASRIFKVVKGLQMRLAV